MREGDRDGGLSRNRDGGTGSGGDRGYAPAPSRAWRLRARREGNPLLASPTPLERIVFLGVVALTLLVLAAVAFAVVAVGSVANGVATRQSTQRHQVVATAIGAPQHSMAFAGVSAAAAENESQHVRWYFRGKRHDDRVRAGVVGASGSTTTIWVDGAGNHTTSPTTTTDVAVARIIVGLGAAVIALVVLVAVHSARRRWLMRRRMRNWEVEWETVGPLWTGHSGKP